VTTIAPCDKANILPACSVAQILVDQEVWARYESNAFFPDSYFAAFSTEVVAFISISLCVSSPLFLIYATGKPGARDDPGPQQERCGRGLFCGHFLVYRYFEASLSIH